MGSVQRTFPWKLEARGKAKRMWPGVIFVSMALAVFNDVIR